MTISNRTVERCIEECLQCLRWCAQCRAESLDQDPIMMRDCIRFCNECLELCRTCVALLTASSGFAHRVCGICSQLCTACAAECGKYEGETMRKCAQACRQCAATCAEVEQAGQFGGLLHKMKVWATGAGVGIGEDSVAVRQRCSKSVITGRRSEPLD
jgi:hypothetical protein